MFDNGIFFKSYNVPQIGHVFLEYLVNGELSLFKYKEKFLLKKGNRNFHFIEQKEEKVLTDRGREAYKKSTKYKGTLIYLVADCGQLQEKAQTTVYSRTGIKDLVKRYNRCQGSDFKVYQQKGPGIKLKFGLAGSYNSYRLNIKPIVDGYYYLQGDYQYSYPEGGFMMVMELPKLLPENISFQLEAVYSRNELSASYVLEDQYTYINNEAYIEYETIAIPFSMMYKFENLPLNPFLNLGVIASNKFNAYTERVEEYHTEYPGGDLVQDKYENPFSLSTTHIGVWGGMGISQPVFKMVEFQLGLRYFQLTDFIGSGINTPNFNRISLFLGIKQL